MPKPFLEWNSSPILEKSPWVECQTNDSAAENQSLSKRYRRKQFEPAPKQPSQESGLGQESRHAMNRGIDPKSQAEPERRGFHREEVSRRDKKLSLAVDCVRKACPDVMQGQFWEVSDHFLSRPPSRQILQNVLDRDPEPTDTRFPTALVRLNGEDLVIVHSLKVLELSHTSNSRRRTSTPQTPPRATG